MDDKGILSKQQGAGLVATVLGWPIMVSGSCSWSCDDMCLESCSLLHSFLIPPAPCRERKQLTASLGLCCQQEQQVQVLIENRYSAWAQSRLALGGLACSMSKDYPHQLSRNDAFRTILGCAVQNHLQGFRGFPLYHARWRVPVRAKVHIRMWTHVCSFSLDAKPIPERLCALQTGAVTDFVSSC